jgi:hypothetical protein
MKLLNWLELTFYGKLKGLKNRVIFKEEIKPIHTAFDITTLFI